MNILVAVPSMDSVPAHFAQSLAMLKKVGNVAVAFKVGSLVYTSRNELAQHAIKMEADYVLWLDSDMKFEPDLLEKMMATMDHFKVDVLSGLYFKRVPPYTPVAFDKLELEDDGRCSHHYLDHVPGGVMQIAGCGFGCVLMKIEVLLDVIAEFRDVFSPFAGVGEDLSFCIRARKCGHSIWLDPSIELGHCGHTIITRDYFEAYQEKGDLNNDSK